MLNIHLCSKCAYLAFCSRSTRLRPTGVLRFRHAFTCAMPHDICVARAAVCIGILTSVKYDSVTLIIPIQRVDNVINYAWPNAQSVEQSDIKTFYLKRFIPYDYFSNISSFFETCHNFGGEELFKVRIVFYQIPVFVQALYNSFCIGMKFCREDN